MQLPSSTKQQLINALAVRLAGLVLVKDETDEEFRLELNAITFLCQRAKADLTQRRVVDDSQDDEL